MRALPLGLPFQGRWLGAAETERLSRICDNLSVSCADSIPTPFVPSGHFPLIGGIGPWEGSRGLRGLRGRRLFLSTSGGAHPPGSPSRGRCPLSGGNVPKGQKG